MAIARAAQTALRQAKGEMYWITDAIPHQSRYDWSPRNRRFGALAAMEDAPGRREKKQRAKQKNSPLEPLQRPRRQGVCFFLQSIGRHGVVTQCSERSPFS